MKTLFSRILLAQVVSVVLALAVVTIITRYSLNQGFKTFLERQETAVLQTAAPVLTGAYKGAGSWDFLRENKQNWQRIWHATRGQEAGGRRPRRGMRREDIPPPSGPPQDPLLRWMQPPGRGMLRERLFLLDENHRWIAGAETDNLDVISLEKLELDGVTVGWIGFTPTGNLLPPDAEQFLNRQVRITALSLTLALLVAAALAFFLARNVSRPFRQLGITVRRLSSGEYEARAPAGVYEEIGRLAAHVNQLAETLEKNRTARQRWMADIAHELRTPVAVLKGEIEALADGVREADERMAVSLAEEVNHLAALVDDLQALALADAGALNIRKEPVDVSNLVGQVAEAFRNRLAAREVRLELSVGEEITITGDSHRLRQLVHNLLENSCRYVEEGAQVRLQLNEDRGVILLLEDSGPGVSNEQLGRLFERFYRAESSRSRSTGGTGLGLSICRSIVEAHGGEIVAKRSAMGGLAIRISLPATG